MHSIQLAALITVFAHSIPKFSQATTSTSPDQVYSILPSSLPSGTCGSTSDFCPECDGQSFTDGWAYPYRVHCDSMVTSSDDYYVTNFSAANATQDCLQACDDFVGCLGVTCLPEVRCILATGSFVGVAQNPGYNAFVRATGSSYTSVDNAMTSSSLSRKSTEPSSTHRTSSTTRSHSSAQVTGSPKLPPYSNTTASSSSCQASNVSCTACDGTSIIDSRGNTYQVHCDAQLLSDDDYSPQEWLSPEGCLLECDNYAWCQGASFWQQGNCMLAKGSATEVQPFEMPGYTAFLPVAKSTSGSSSTASSAATPTATAHTKASTHAAPTCNPTAALCPTCDSYNVTDPLNAAYSISCSTTPLCEETINRANGTTQIECLEYCDQDATCFAATWEEESCDLCMRAWDGEALLSRARTGSTVVYYSATEKPSVVTSANSKFTAKTVPARSGSSSSTSLSLLQIDGNTMEAAPSTQNDFVIASTVTPLPPAFIAQPTMETITDYILTYSRVSAAESSVTSKSLSRSVATASASTSSSTTVVSSSTSSMPSRSSSFVAEITGTVTSLGPVQAASTTPFIPPLSGTVISYATPGPDLTRLAGGGRRRDSASRASVD